MDNEVVDVFLILTPFNAYLAREIIMSRGIKFAKIVVQLKVNSNLRKIERQIERIKLLCHLEIEYIFTNNVGACSDVKNVISLLTYPSFSCRNLFLANVDHFEFDFLLTYKIKFESLYTFDDGCANVIESSSYFLNDVSFSKKKALTLLFNCKYGLMKIKDTLDKHYTIYPTMNNAMGDNCEVINTFCEFASHKKNGKKKVLLGTVYEEMFLPEFKLECIQKFIENYNIDYYIPHPREGCNNIISNRIEEDDRLLAEEIILDLAKNSNVEVFGFFSSSLLNLIGHDSISVVTLYHPEIKVDESCIDSFLSVGIECMHI